METCSGKLSRNGGRIQVVSEVQIRCDLFRDAVYCVRGIRIGSGDGWIRAMLQCRFS